MAEKAKLEIYFLFLGLIASKLPGLTSLPSPHSHQSSMSHSRHRHAFGIGMTVAHARLFHVFVFEDEADPTPTPPRLHPTINGSTYLSILWCADPPLCRRQSGADAKALGRW
jgi:hypothetical protein